MRQLSERVAERDEPWRKPKAQSNSSVMNSAKVEHVLADQCGRTETNHEPSEQQKSIPNRRVVEEDFELFASAPQHFLRLHAFDVICCLAR